MRTIIRNTARNWMLGMSLVAGMLGVGAATANAAPLQFRVGVEEGYVPPCPGDGYIWTAGYYDGGYWVPGAWNFRGRRGFEYGRDIRYGARFDRGYGRGYDHGFDRNRGFDRSRSFDRGSDHGRGFEHGNHGRR